MFYELYKLSSVPKPDLKFVDVYCYKQKHKLFEILQTYNIHILECFCEISKLKERLNKPYALNNRKVPSRRRGKKSGPPSFLATMSTSSLMASTPSSAAAMIRRTRPTGHRYKSQMRYSRSKNLARFVTSTSLHPCRPTASEP